MVGGPITILLVEDHTLVLEGLRRMLELEADFKVVGEANNGRAAVAMASELRPSVVLMDIAMPGLNGLEATRQVLKLLPNTKVIILTAHSDDTYVGSAASCGAAGFLLKDSSASQVRTAIREVVQGRTLYSAAISQRLARLRQRARPGPFHVREGTALLTSREMEVLQLIAEGKANKETAADLGISVKTVEKHRGHIMEKLDIHDTASLTRYAISAGIIENSTQPTVV